MIDMKGSILSSNFKFIEKDLWERKDIYDIFSNVDYQFYSVTIPVDITKVKKSCIVMIQLF